MRHKGHVLVQHANGCGPLRRVSLDADVHARVWGRAVDGDAEPICVATAAGDAKDGFVDGGDAGWVCWVVVGLVTIVDAERLRGCCA